VTAMIDPPEVKPVISGVSLQVALFALGVFLAGNAGEQTFDDGPESTLRAVLLWFQMVAGICFVISVALGVAGKLRK
jgi:hypothetical protein